MNDDQYLQTAIEIGDRILADERQDPNRAPWPFAGGGDMIPPGEYADLYEGATGTVLFLLALYQATKDDRYLQASTRACDWLIRHFDAEKPKNFGLYIGPCGRALALLDLSQTTGSRAYRDRALEMASWASNQNNEWLELLFGAAGSGLLFLELYHTTGDESWLNSARSCLETLSSSAQPYGDSGALWPAMRGGGWTAFGLAHGVAGILVFLRAMARVDPASNAADLARSAERALIQSAQPSGGGLDWTTGPGANELLVQWCHGAPGVGIAFLASSSAEAMEEACAAGRATAAAGVTRDNASQCHGVCGNAELFIELYRHTRESEWLDEARRFAELAEPFRLKDQGPGVWRTHDDDTITYDLMTGIAGVGYFFLRLARPLEAPYPVIGRWLQPAAL